MTNYQLIYDVYSYTHVQYDCLKNVNKKDD